MTEQALPQNLWKLNIEIVQCHHTRKYYEIYLYYTKYSITQFVKRQLNNNI
jgi:hypothetical protein